MNDGENLRFYHGISLLRYKVDCNDMCFPQRIALLSAISGVEDLISCLARRLCTGQKGCSINDKLVHSCEPNPRHTETMYIYSNP